MRSAVILVSLLLAGTTACSADKSSDGGGQAETSPTTAGQSGSTAPTDQPVEPAKPLPQINAAQVVAGMTGAGYKCGRDSTYAICTSGPVAVWVLTGTHKRPPVVSLHARGTVEAATAAIANELPRALELAHVNERAQIAAWFDQQGGQTSAQTTAGDWRVELSTEVDTEEPGAHLTLTDKLCKGNCQGE